MPDDNKSVEKKSVSKNVIFLGFVSLFNDIASEMIYPIVPIFLKSVLGAPASVIGLIEGIAESTASLLKVISGWFSDKFKRRKVFIIFGYGLSSISKVLMGLAGSWPFVLFARFIDRFGKGTRTSARDALILESTEPENRGRAFGLHRSMDSLGAVIGPLLALVLIYFFQDKYSTIFFIAFIPSFLGVLLIFFVKEKAKFQTADIKQAVTPAFKFRWSDLDSRFKSFLFVSIVFAIGNSSDAFLILRSQNLGLSIFLTVAAYVLYNMTYSIFSYPAGIISDKIGPKKVLAAGFWIFALVYLLFGLVNQSFYVWILFPLYGIYIALTDGVSKAYIAKSFPAEKSATAFGAYQTAVGLCTFLASFVAGLLWNFVSPKAPFIFGGIMAGIAAIIFMISKKD
jgi:MFS family permease